jgi:hypothetical protein
MVHECSQHGANGIAGVVLEGYEQGEELNREFTAVPRPYDKYLRGIRYEEYKSRCKSDK